MEKYNKIDTIYCENAKVDADIYQHIKTGALVANIKSSDHIQSFGIGFNTYASNNNGYAHIVEHCVLCGSKKYPVKDVFNEIYRSTFTTYLNAYTASEFTMYSFATPSKKEFDSLTKIYLDCVFDPLLLKNEQIFLQEGLRLQYDEDEDSFVPNGVVYSEMKHVFDDFFTTIVYKMKSTFQQGTPYQYEHGGYPPEMLNANYHDILEFYHKFYQPSNAIVLFYGDVDIEEKLNYLDEEYFSKYERFEDVYKGFNFISNQTQKKFKFTYPALSSQDNQKYNYSFVKKIDTQISKADLLLVRIIAATIIPNPNSTMYKSIISSMLCSEMDGYSNVYLFGAKSFYFYLSNCPANSRDRIKQTYNQALTKMIEEIDLDQFKSMLLNYLLSLEEKSILVSKRGIKTIDSLYGELLNKKYSLQYVDFKEDTIRELLKTVNKEKLQSILRQYFYFDEENTYEYEFEPSLSYVDEQREKLLEDVKTLNASLTAENKKLLIRKSEDFEEYQNEEDTLEALNTIPRLTLNDLPPRLTEVKSEIVNIANNYDIYYQEVPTENVVYYRYGFDLKGASDEDFSYLILLSYLYFLFPTKNHSAMEISNLLQNKCINIDNIIGNYYKKTLKSFFYVTMSGTKGSLAGVDELIFDYLFTSDFNQKATMKSEIQNILNSHDANFNSGSQDVCDNMTLSQNNLGFYKEEKALGLSSLKFLKELNDNFDEEFPYILEKLRQVITKFFVKERFFVYASCDKQSLPLVKDISQSFYDKLQSKAIVDESFYPLLTKSKKAYIVSSDINTMSFTFDVDITKHKKGSLIILCKVILAKYLYPLVRLRLGAYSSFICTYNEGSILINANSVPDIGKTFEIIENIPDFISSINLSAEELEQFKIAVYAELEEPQDYKQRAYFSFIRKISNVSYQEHNEVIEQVLNTTNEDLAGFSETFSNGLANMASTVIGNKEDIIKNNDLFDSVIELKKQPLFKI